MCFSPTASFSVSAGLAIVGIMTLRSSARHELLFASIPLLFSVQQFIEGAIWLVLLHKWPVTSEYWLTQGYVIFVGMVWPVMVSFSLWMIEPEAGRRNMMLAVIAVGVGIALFTLHAILQFPVTVSIRDHCIFYDYPVPQPHYMLAFYVIATCGAFFCSSDRAIVRLGWINILAFLVTYYFYRYDLTSVWCFFAAFISGVIFLYFDERAKAKLKSHPSA